MFACSCITIFGYLFQIRLFKIKCISMCRLVTRNHLTRGRLALLLGFNRQTDFPGLDIWEMKYLAHNQIESLRFLTDYQSSFTTRSDGSSWPNWQKTWLHATQYFRGLVRPGTNKSVAGIASMVNIKQEKLERFVRENAWEYESVEENLRTTAPEAAQ